MEAELVELINSFASASAEGTSSIAREGLKFLKKSGNRDQAHNRLCSALLERAEGGNADIKKLLFFAGEDQALVIIYNNIAHTKLPIAKWLASEVSSLLTQDSYLKILTANSKRGYASPPSSGLPLQQEHLVSVVCRLPDVLANRLGRQLRETLLPDSYFTQLGECLGGCLEAIHREWKGSGEGGYALLFPAALLGKAAALGQQGAVLKPLVPLLVEKVLAPAGSSWSSLCQQLFSHVPQVGLEPVLETLINSVPPSLLPSSPFCLLIGRDLLNNHRAKFILTQKLVLIRVPPSPNAVYNLLGYLASTELGRELLGKSLRSALEVWSDSTSLRHMAGRQHLWLSSFVVLGMTLLEEHGNLETIRPTILKLLMAGVEVHMQTPLLDVRHLGMAVGECLMNKLHKTTEDEPPLKLDYKASPEVIAVTKLARPIAEQEEELKKETGSTNVSKPLKMEPEPVKEEEEEEVVSGKGSPLAEKYGEGFVHAVQCSESDSDDDLVPYPMDEEDDPDVSKPAPPRYIRSLMQDLLATKEPHKVEVALATANSLIRSEPPGLSEVCVELAKILLHLSDNFAFEDFTSQRHRAMVSLAVLCPTLVTPYLTHEFYAPNNSLRYRMDILEVISAAALELSGPAVSNSSSSSSSSSLHGQASSSSAWSTRKPWEEIIKQRLKSKTRVISKGPSKPPSKSAPNRFTTVAPLFFFPLMNQYDQQVNTLDLLGEDSLVLGTLLFTLGTVMYAAINLPLVPPMALALLDFLWALRYHRDAYVRQGVLYSLGMLLLATPRPVLMEEHFAVGLSEAMAWTKEILTEDADEQCRMLAGHALTLFNSSMKQT